MLPAPPREMRPEDAGSLTTLSRACFPEGGYGLPYWRHRAAPPALCVLIDGASGPIAYCDGFLVGDGGDVVTIGTDPAHRRSGLGRAVLAGFLDVARARGAAVIHLEVAETNEAARCLYTAAGFETVGRRLRYYEDGADALVLARTLA